MKNVKRNVNQDAGAVESLMEIADNFVSRFFCNLLELHSNIDDIPPADNEATVKT